MQFVFKNNFVFNKAIINDSVFLTESSQKTNQAFSSNKGPKRAFSGAIRSDTGVFA